MTRKISVIIPTYNEKDSILDCLKSLDKQNLKDFEVIVIDDGSTDETQKLIENYKANNYSLSLLKQNHQGPASARNLGASQAMGDILVFVDADMTFDRKFINKLTQPIVSSKTKGTFSKWEYVSNWENVWAKCWNINQNWPSRRRHPSNQPNKQKVFRAILKSEFLRIGGFSKGGYTDDYTLSAKLGYLADSSDKAVFYHTNPDSLKEVFNQARWSAKRAYKLGLFGVVAAYVRALPIFSLVIGFGKSLVNRTPAFFVFKLIYDVGTLVGLTDMVVFKKLAK